MEAVTFSIRVPRRVADSLDAKAKRADRSRNWLVGYLLAQALEQVPIPEAPLSPLPSHGDATSHDGAKRRAARPTSEY